MARSSRSSHVNIDVSKRAASELDVVLDQPDDSKAQVQKITLDEARYGQTVFNPDTGRTKARVLFISTDASLLDPNSVALQYYADLQDQFDEIHILVLRTGRTPRHGALRVSKKVWLYVAAATYWWWLPVVARSVAINELVFAGGFRADIIVTDTPFESGIAGYWLASKYERPLQVQVRQNIYRPAFKKAAPGNWLRYYAAEFLLARVLSVRTLTHKLRQVIAERFPELPDVQVLPQFHDYARIVSEPPAVDIHDHYPQFSFIMLFVGDLVRQSALPRVIKQLTKVLQNPRAGLVVLGTGPQQIALEKYVEKLGVTQQVVFVAPTPSTDTISYLKTANVVFVTDTTADSDELVLDAAAAGAAMVATKTEVREAILENGTSAFLCEPDDFNCLELSFDALLNDVTQREKFSHNAKRAMQEQVHEDRSVFKQVFRASIEAAALVEQLYETSDHNSSG